MFTDLFEYQETVVKTESKLTPRQWKLYEFLKEISGKRMKQQELLESYENWLLQRGFALNKYSYNYYEEKRANKHFSDMTSARNMRKDWKVLELDNTIQKVLVRNKIANTEVEAFEHLHKEKIAALKKLKGIYVQLAKLAKHDQMRLQFNQERDVIEAILEKEVE
jgi:hypothetical protein